MTDIVERLRGHQDIHMSVPVEDLLLDAADEIERLRAAAHKLLNALEFCHAQGETFHPRISIAAADLQNAVCAAPGGKPKP